MKAVFPVNGLGTRFLPATKAMPKEMLHVVDKPLIQYAVEEAAAAGVTEMIFVTGRTKRAIEDHFDNRPELERELEEMGKMELLETLQDIVPAGITCLYIRQSESPGLGHVVLCARPVVGNDPFAVPLADDLVDADVSVTKQLAEARERAGGGNVLAVQQVPREHTKRYGIVSTSATDEERRFDVSSIVEKPDPEVAPSTEAVIGRYVFEPSIFEYLANQKPGAGSEIQLTDAITASLGDVHCSAYRFEGRRYDCGSKQGFVDATVHFARKRGFSIAED